MGDSEAHEDARLRDERLTGEERARALEAELDRLRQRLKEAEGLAEALEPFALNSIAPANFSEARIALDRWRKGPTHEHRFLTDEDGAVHPCVCGEPWRKGEP